jgi:hypothetical protein
MDSKKWLVYLQHDRHLSTCNLTLFFLTRQMFMNWEHNISAVCNDICVIALHTGITLCSQKSLLPLFQEIFTRSKNVPNETCRSHINEIPYMTYQFLFKINKPHQWYIQNNEECLWSICKPFWHATFHIGFGMLLNRGPYSLTQYVTEKHGVTVLLFRTSPLCHQHGCWKHSFHPIHVTPEYMAQNICHGVRASNYIQTLLLVFHVVKYFTSFVHSL